MSREVRLTNPDDIAALDRMTMTARERVTTRLDPETIKSRERWAERRKNGPTGILRGLDVGATHLFGYKHTQQLSPYIAVLKDEGRYFTSKKVAEGVLVTRVAPPALPHPADGLV